MGLLNLKGPTPHHELPVVFITGCGAGLGYALAQRFYLRNDFRVVVTARGELDLKKLRLEFPENERFIVRHLDVTDKLER